MPDSAASGYRCFCGGGSARDGAFPPRRHAPCTVFVLHCVEAGRHGGYAEPTMSLLRRDLPTLPRETIKYYPSACVRCAFLHAIDGFVSISGRRFFGVTLTPGRDDSLWVTSDFLPSAFGLKTLRGEKSVASNLSMYVSRIGNVTSRVCVCACVCKYVSTLNASCGRRHRPVAFGIKPHFPCRRYRYCPSKRCSTSCCISSPG